MQKLSMRERMLAMLQGRAFDRIPFLQYDNMNAPNDEIWAALGRESMGVLRWTVMHRFESPDCRIETEQTTHNNLPAYKDTLITPKGNLQQLRVLVPDMYGVTATREHYVKKIEDYEILLAYLKDITVVEDSSSTEKAIDELGTDGLPLVALPRTPYQALWVEWVSVENLCLHMIDRPAMLDECMNLLGNILLESAKVTASQCDRVDLPFVGMGDNITAPVIGENFFRKYALPYYNRIADILAEKNVPFIVHMDGDLKPLWSAIGESKISGIDSFSPAPDNDTTVAEAVSMWPEKKFFINFPSSVHLADTEVIYQHACEILAQGGHTRRIWIQISENAPKNVWKKSFPQIIKAIEDFGKP